MKRAPKTTNDIYQVTKPDEMDLVCFSHLRWNFVFQRPQHLMTRIARERRVFFIEEPVIDEGPARMEIAQQNDRLWVAVPHLPEKLSKEDERAAQIDLVDQLLADHNINQFIAWYYTPMAIEFSFHLKPAAIVYDCMDELSAFNGAHPRMLANEKELMEKADLVFTGGNSLYEAKKKHHSNAHAFPSSIDMNHFSKARSAVMDPIDQMHIPHPRIGFFGVIDERCDTDLIAGVAAARPDWHIVMIGPVVKVDPHQLPHLPNIHYLGQKNYAELPQYLAHWDVAMLPFAINRATEFISPTKTPEYLAGGKPVISTPIRDVINPYGDKNLVHIVKDAPEFVQACEHILQDEWDRAAWLKKVDQQLSTNSWDYTYTRMMQLIESALYAGVDTGDKYKTKNNGLPTLPAATVQALVEDLNPEPAGLHMGNGASAIFDYLIVGAGFAGSVLAERLARGSGKRVLLIDTRSHIGGNAYDHFNEDGLLVHKYGPHIFHTNSREVFEYLGRFTEWRQYEHHVLASVDGQLVPIPINLDTINRLYGLSLTAQDLPRFYESVAEPRDPIRTSEDVVVSKVGRELYEKFFRNYTRKQWDLDPSQLDAQVTARVPVRYNRDSRYFTDSYQSMPLYGYTRMFEQMLDHPNIKIMLNTDYHEIADFVRFREMIFTGPVDEYFNYVYGKLPYRSLQFKFETHNKERYQPEAVVNFPNEHLYTRVTEFKYLTGQQHPKTTIVYEYPCAEGDPYYPIPRPENAELYKRYQKLAASTPGVYFAGRLATYKYYNMDQVVAQALTLYAKIAGVKDNQAAATHTPHYIPVSLPRSAEPVK